VPVEAIREQGLMNSKRYPNFGDAEYTPRLKRNNWRLLIDPRARVFCQPNTLSKRISDMSLKEKINALFLDLGHGQNLRRHFYHYIDSAPSRLQGFVGFIIFFIRAISRKLLGVSKNESETDISLMFANAVIED
jgi:hypothetical protein